MMFASVTPRPGRELNNPHSATLTMARSAMRQGHGIRYMAEVIHYSDALRGAQGDAQALEHSFRLNVHPEEIHHAREVLERLDNATYSPTFPAQVHWAEVIAAKTGRMPSVRELDNTISLVMDKHRDENGWTANLDYAPEENVIYWATLDAYGLDGGDFSE